MGKTAFRAEFRRSARHCADRRRHFTAIEAATVKKKKRNRKRKKTTGTPSLEHIPWLDSLLSSSFFSVSLLVKKNPFLCFFYRSIYRYWSDWIDLYWVLPLEHVPGPSFSSNFIELRLHRFRRMCFYWTAINRVLRIGFFTEFYRVLPGLPGAERVSKRGSHFEIPFKMVWE